MLNCSEYAGAFRAELFLTNRAWLLWNAYPSFMLVCLVHEPPELFRFKGHLQMRYPKRRQASMMALATPVAEPMVPASPMPFAPKGLSRVGDGASGFEGRQHGRLGHGIIHQAAGISWPCAS